MGVSFSGPKTPNSYPSLLRIGIGPCESSGAAEIGTTPLTSLVLSANTGWWGGASRVSLAGRYYLGQAPYTGNRSKHDGGFLSARISSQGNLGLGVGTKIKEEGDLGMDLVVGGYCKLEKPRNITPFVGISLLL